MERSTLRQLWTAAMAACAAMLLAPGTLWATADTWKTAASGTFSTGSNWTDGTAPASIADTATFNPGAGAYTVTFTASVSNLNLTVGQGPVTFESSGGPWTYSMNSGSSVTTVSSGGTLYLGTSGKPLNLANALVSPINGTLEIRYGSDFVSYGYLDVGSGSGLTGRLTVDGAGSLAQAYYDSTWGTGGATANVTFRNSAAGQFNIVYLASGATAGTNGTLSVESGANLVLTNLYVANSGTTGTGTITVTGAGSAVTQTGASTLTIGHASTGTATLNISNSGAYTTGTGTTTVNKTATVNIGDGATPGTLTAGGSLMINGGKVYRKTGSTFTWAASKTLTVQNGGLFSVTGDWTTPAGATVNVTGALSQATVSNALVVNGGSQITAQSGGKLSVAQASIGSTTAGTVIVDGAGSTLTSSNYVSLGGTGGAAALTLKNTATGTVTNNLTLAADYSTPNTVGALSIETGAALQAGTVIAGPGGLAGQQATINVSGAGSALTVTGGGTLSLGADANSTTALNINNSGAVTTGTGATTVNKTATVNVGDGATAGTLTVNGDIAVNGGQVYRKSGSTFTWAASKTMTVSGGGLFSMQSGNYVLPAAAAVTVTGAGSKAEVISGDLTVNSGTPVNVQSQGTLQTTGSLSLGSIGAGTVTIDGTGSTLTVGDWCYVHGAAASTLTLRNGSGGTVAGTLTVAANSTAGATGTVNVQSGASLSASGLLAGTWGQAGQSATINVTGAGSTLILGGGNLTLGAAGNSLAAVNVTAGGELRAQSSPTTLWTTATVNLDGGTVAFGPLTWNGGVINFTSGSLSYGGDLTVGPAGLLGQNLTLAANRRLTLTGATAIDAFQTLTLDGGSLSTGSLTVNGALDFRRGTLAFTGVGGLAIGSGGPLGAGATLRDGCNLCVTNTLAVDADGTLSLQGGQASAGTFANSGQIVLASVTGGLAGGTLSNSGILSGTGTVAASLTNQAAGQVRAAAGNELRFTGAGNSNAGLVSLTGGQFEFTQGLTNDSAGLISGRGAIITGGSGLANNGNIGFSGGFTDVYGDVANNSGAKVIISGVGTTTFYDDVNANGGEMRVGAGCSLVFFGSYNGSTTGTGTVYMEGDLRPGHSPAAIAFEGDLVLGSGATLVAELAGATAGSQYDQVTIGGQATLAGTLDVELLYGFRPHAGQTFDILNFDPANFSGKFDAIDLPDLGGGLSWDTSSLYTTGSLGVVPEPATIALLVTGLAGAALRRRRR